jgi:hypothetical protein
MSVDTNVQHITRQGLVQMIEITEQRECPVTKLWDRSVTGVETNALGVKVPLETVSNPSLGFINAGGGDLATPGNPTLSHLLIYYVLMQMGYKQDYSYTLNRGKEGVKGVDGFALKSNAQRFAKWREIYTSSGNGTTALATASAAYASGSPTVAVCNGATDGTGATQVLPGQRLFVYSADGATQRVGTVGAGALTVNARTKTTITFTTNLPSDYVIGDIFVPASVSTVGPKGVPYMVNNTGVYYNRNSTDGLAFQSTIIPASGDLSVSLLMSLYSGVTQAGGEESGLVFLMGTAQHQKYHNLLQAAPFSRPLNIDGNSLPKPDAGFSTMDYTWFGIPIVRGKDLLSTRVDLINRNYIGRADLKDMGPMLDMPAGQWLQMINGATSSYVAAKARWDDMAWDNYIANRPKHGAITGLGFANVQLPKS